MLIDFIVTALSILQFRRKSLVMMLTRLSPLTSLFPIFPCHMP
jgi:hypothetical protein